MSGVELFRQIDSVVSQPAGFTALVFFYLSISQPHSYESQISSLPISRVRTKERLATLLQQCTQSRISSSEVHQLLACANSIHSISIEILSRQIARSIIYDLVVVNVCQTSCIRPVRQSVIATQQSILSIPVHASRSLKIRFLFKKIGMILLRILFSRWHSFSFFVRIKSASKKSMRYVAAGAIFFAIERARSSINLKKAQMWFSCFRSVKFLEKKAVSQVIGSWLLGCWMQRRFRRKRDEDILKSRKSKAAIIIQKIIRGYISRLVFRSFKSIQSIHRINCMKKTLRAFCFSMSQRKLQISVSQRKIRDFVLGAVARWKITHQQDISILSNAECECHRSLTPSVHQKNVIREFLRRLLRARYRAQAAEVAPIVEPQTAQTTVNPSINTQELLKCAQISQRIIKRAFSVWLSRFHESRRANQRSTTAVYDNINSDFPKESANLIEDFSTNILTLGPTDASISESESTTSLVEHILSSKMRIISSFITRHIRRFQKRLRVKQIILFLKRWKMARKIHQTINRFRKVKRIELEQRSAFRIQKKYRLFRARRIFVRCQLLSRFAIRAHLLSRKMNSLNAFRKLEMNSMQIRIAQEKVASQVICRAIFRYVLARRNRETMNAVHDLIKRKKRALQIDNQVQHLYSDLISEVYCIKIQRVARIYLKRRQFIQAIPKVVEDHYVTKVIKIQSLFRGYLTRKQYCIKSNEAAKLIEDCGPWQEFYDESAHSKYWFNSDTGEASWIRPY